MAHRRRVYAIAAIFAIVVVGAWWFGLLSPHANVALTSRSMSHSEENLKGVLDPGEAVSLARVLSRDDVVTAAEGKASGHRVGDEWGDIISFDSRVRGQDGGIGIVHRPLVWVEWDEQTGAYDVPELGLQDVHEFVIPDVGTWDAWTQRYIRVDQAVALDPESAGRHDGFLTKGDHNNGVDQDRYGGLVDLGTVELVEVWYIDGRVSDWHEPHESLRTAYIAFGLAGLATVAVVTHRRGLWSLPARGGTRCSGCGSKLESGHGFCPRCGRSTP